MDFNITVKKYYPKPLENLVLVYKIQLSLNLSTGFLEIFLYFITHIPTYILCPICENIVVLRP